MVEDYYALLELDASAKGEEIQSSIRAKRKRYRQLTGSPDQTVRLEAEMVMAKIADAERVLLDSHRRADYDKEWREQQSVKQQPIPQPPIEFEHEVVYETEQQRTRRSNPTSHLNDLEYWIRTGKDYLAQSQYKSANMAVDEALKMDRSYEPGWHLKADISEREGDIEGALFALDQAKLINPNDLATRERQILLCFNNDRYGSVKSLCESVFAEFGEENLHDLPWWKMVYLNSAYHDDYSDSALAEYRSIYEQYKKDSRVQYWFGSKLLNLGWNTASRSGDQYVIINRKQYDRISEILSEISNLGLKDVVDQDAYKQLNRFKNDAGRYRFVGCTGIIVFGLSQMIIPIILNSLEFGVAKAIFLGIYLLSFYLLWKLTFMRQWDINFNQSTLQERQTGLR